MINNTVDETSVRVRYAETDAMGIVHHSQYIIWFEVGRSSFMRSTGLSYARIEEDGFCFRIADLGARYLAPAFYDEVITIRTWLSELHSRGLVFSYAIVRPGQPKAGKAEEILVTGHTKLVCTDREGQVRRFPERFRELLQPLVTRDGSKGGTRRASLPPAG